MSDTTIARYYDAEKNPQGAMLMGVPLRDLTEQEYADLPKWLQASVDDSPFYRKTRPRRAASDADGALPAPVEE